MIAIEADTYDDLQRGVYATLMNEPEYVSGARGSITKEVLSATLRLRDPRARISTSPTRGMNYGPLISKFLQTARGEDDKWNEAVAALVKDVNSRDVLVSVSGSLSLQFFVRDMNLHLHATVASLDAVWGLTDTIFLLTLVQELMQIDLRKTYPSLDLGSMVLTVGSLYLYERHFELATIVGAEPPRSTGRMLPIESRADLDALAKDEAALRERHLVSVGGYRGGAAWMFDALLTDRMKRDRDLWPRREQALAA